MQIRIAPALLTAVALTGLTAVARPAAAQSPTDTSTLAFVGGTPIQRVRTAWAGLTPQQRASKVQDRVNAVLGMGPIHPGQITVGVVEGDWCVLVRGRRFLTADPETAKLNHSNPKALAQDWAKRMQVVLPDLTGAKPAK